MAAAAVVVAAVVVALISTPALSQDVPAGLAADLTGVFASVLAVKLLLS